MASSMVERSRRRKIALACEPCRDRKSRCDGGTPICSSCQRRGLALELCIYKLDNARTASNEAYIRALHEQIRSLEDACKENDIPVPPVGLDKGQSTSETATGTPQILERGDGAISKPEQDHASVQREAIAPPDGGENPARLASQPQGPNGGISPGSTTQNSCHDPRASLPLDMLPLALADQIDSPDASSGVTAMGTLSTADGDVNSALKRTNEFYGSSSAAFFAKEAYGSMQDGNAPRLSTGAGLLGVPARSGFEGCPAVDLLHATHAFHFALPPRFVADQLLDEFWRRVYYLYPIFHRSTFESAYRSLWEDGRAAGNSAGASAAASSGELGLGGSPGAGPATIVFHCALNTIFALGSLFLDAPASAKTNATQVYFLRAKHFIGLDFLDMNNIGVVQSLLLMTLFLQSTPFASRCWNAVGIACRVAQGLGLHAEPDQASRSPLETEVRRRTWHSCVILDRLVSMTFGRPTMTMRSSSLELPSALDQDLMNGVDGVDGTQSVDSSRYLFNVEHIRLCNILGEILSQIFQPSDRPVSAEQSNGRLEGTRHGLDTMLALDAQLSTYEKTVHPNLSWMQLRPLTSVREDIRLILEIQRNVLHVRFLYFRLMLHRPTLTQVCMVSNVEPDSSSLSDASDILYQSCASESAKICIQSAMQLLEVLSRTYKTPTTITWWWAGLYASTAGLVLLIGRSNPVLEASIGPQAMEQSWHICQAMLKDLSSLSPSAQRSLKLLQALDTKLASRNEGSNAALGSLETQRLANNHVFPSGSNPSRDSSRFPTAGMGPETLYNQFTTGPYPSSSLFPSVQVEDIPDFDMEGSFFNWDQAFNFMANAP